MADRDVTLDIVARDKTGPGIISTERNLKRVGQAAEKNTSAIGKMARQFAATGSSARRVADQWGRGFTKIGQAAKRWSDSGHDSGNGFVRGASRGLSKMFEVGGKVAGFLAKGFSAGIGVLSEAGSLIGKQLSTAVQAAGPYAQIAMAIVIAGLATVAAAAAPAIGAAIAGGIVGGVGLGGVVGGLLIASKDARVAGAFDSLKEEIGTDLQDAAKRFVPATLDAVKKAKSAFKGMLPDLRRLFDVTATFLGPLTESIGRGARSALSGITQALTKAGPIVKVIGEGIEGLLDGVGDGFKMLADNGAGMALALKGAFFLVEVALRGTFFVLNVLVEAFEKVASVIPGLKGKLAELKTGQDGAKTSAFNLSGGFKALATDSNAAADGITNAKTKADEFTNANISLGRAQIAAREAVKNATGAITENNNAKLTNKERSDKNMTALLNLADAFNTESDAGDRSGISAGKASEAYANNRAKLIAMAEKAGYSKTKAEELAAQLLKVPKNVHTDVNVDTENATTKLETFVKKAQKADGTVINYKVIVTSQGDHYIPGQGKQLKNAGYNSWAPSDGMGTSRTGGPRRTEVVNNNNVRVDLNGRPFFDYVDRTISDSERRSAWRQKVGRR